jgi:DNA-nicking Smr family endonuclease
MGVLRRRVRAGLARDQRVPAYHDAPPEAGGWGATVVVLKPRRRSEGPIRRGSL